MTQNFKKSKKTVCVLSMKDYLCNNERKDTKGTGQSHPDFALYSAYPLLDNLYFLPLVV
jgi:hypothetical protein